jgi:phosphate transport system substrate-binding protein
VKLTRSGALVGLALVTSLAVSACGSDDNTSPDAKGGASTAPSSSNSSPCASGSLTAAGSSAQKNAMDEWTKSYQGTCSGATVNYQPVGSGAGVQQFIAGTVDFAGSDSALKPEEHPKADARCKTGKAIDLPMVVGPIAVTYNLPGVDGLVLDAPTIAKIFSGKITTWSDPAVKALNADAKLPSTKIQAFHRSDESGTTDNFQKYLVAAAPSDWTFGKGKKFNAPGGQSAKGSDGVTQAVTSTAGAVTYAELSFAQNAELPVAKLATGASSPVELTPDSAAKAVEAATVESSGGNDLTLTLDYATKTDGAYPLVLVTYEIVCDKGTATDKLALVKGFLTYTSGDGQKALTDLGYAPLPESIRSKVAAAVSALA